MELSTEPVPMLCCLLRGEEIYFLYCLVIQSQDLQFSRHLHHALDCDITDQSLKYNGKYTSYVFSDAKL